MRCYVVPGIGTVGGEVHTPTPARASIQKKDKTVLTTGAKALIASVVLAFLLPITASAQNAEQAKKLEPLPRDLEIQLALSALPRHLRDNATAYVLNPDKGFEVARKGTNGFHAFVARMGDDTFLGTWPLKEYRDDILYPVSFDEAGAREHMRVFFDAAEMQAKGTPPKISRK